MQAKSGTQLPDAETSMVGHYRVMVFSKSCSFRFVEDPELAESFDYGGHQSALGPVFDFDRHPESARETPVRKHGDCVYRFRSDFADQLAASRPHEVCVDAAH